MKIVNLKKLFSLLYILLLSFTGIGQSHINPLRKFEGVWIGTMETYQNSVRTEDIRIKIEIAPISVNSYKWTYTFYPMKNTEIHKTETIRIINEYGDISAITNKQVPITEYWINNKFYSSYSSGSSHIIQSFYITGDKLYIDLVKSEPDNTDFALSTNSQSASIKPSIVLELKKCVLFKQK